MLVGVRKGHVGVHQREGHRPATLVVTAAAIAALALARIAQLNVGDLENTTAPVIECVRCEGRRLRETPGRAYMQAFGAGGMLQETVDLSVRRAALQPSGAATWFVACTYH